jgi:hypothetical protein
MFEGELVFEDLEITPDMVLLPPSGFKRGFAELINAYNSQRVCAGTVAMGIAAGALEPAVEGRKRASSSGGRSASSRGPAGSSPDKCRGFLQALPEQACSKRQR